MPTVSGRNVKCKEEGRRGRLCVEVGVCISTSSLSLHQYLNEMRVMRRPPSKCHDMHSKTTSEIMTIMCVFFVIHVERGSREGEILG